MAEWISQSNVSSVTKATRSRTAYLAPILDEVVAAIEAYLAEHPDGEEVTLAVLHALGRERLDEVRGDRTFDRVKQDVGLLVAVTLVDLFQAISVKTLRRGDGRSVSTRRNTWPELSWVATYTPHRLVPVTPSRVRILLDTSVVRKVVQDDDDALDVAALRTARGAHPVSIADGALAELAAQLLRGSIAPKLWADRIKELDDLLDPDFPVAPGGKELAAFWGAHPMTGIDINESKAYYRAAWGHLRGIKSADDLAQPRIFHGTSGRAFQIRLDQSHVDRILSETGERWAAWASNTADAIRGIRARGEDITEDDLRRLTMSDLIRDMGVADAMKLDLVMHVLARRGIEAAKPDRGYNPKGKPNDPLDLDLLFGIPLPAWICTQDKRLHRLVRSTKSEARSAVMRPDELLARLRAEAEGSEPE